MSFPPTEVGSPADLAVEVCQDSTYLIYCNSALPSFELLQHWYQYATLGLGGAAILLPIALWIVQWLRRSWRRRRARGRAAARPSEIIIQSEDKGRVTSTPGPTPNITISKANRDLNSDRIPSVMSLRSERALSALSLRSLSEHVPSILRLRDLSEQPVRTGSSLSVREMCEDERRATIVSQLPSPGLYVTPKAQVPYMP
jgi:hypothetical protein